jgi:hypothetical protein
MTWSRSEYVSPLRSETRAREGDRKHTRQASRATSKGVSAGLETVRYLAESTVTAAKLQKRQQECCSKAAQISAANQNNVVMYRNLCE